MKIIIFPDDAKQRYTWYYFDSKISIAFTLNYNDPIF